MNYLKTFLLTALLLLCGLENVVFSQSDTIWLEFKNYQIEISTKELHKAFRIISKQNDNKYEIKDYLKNGMLFRKGISEKADEYFFIGDVKHYKDGFLTKISRYTSYGNGVNIHLTKDSIKTHSVAFLNNCEHGDAEFYDVIGNVISKSQYRDGKAYEGLFPEPRETFKDSTKYTFFSYKNGDLVGFVRYFKNGVRACEVYENDNIKIDSAIYFYPDGKLIGKCKYLENNSPVEGTHVDYYKFKENNKYLNFDSEMDYSHSDARIRSISKLSHGKITERISYDYRGNKIGECIYEDGQPYSGYVLERNELKFYNQNKYFSSSKVYDNKMENIIYEYLSHQGRIYGKSIFYQPDNIFTGEFENDVPWNGIVFNGTELCQYAEGQKVGWCRNFNEDWQVAEEYSYVDNKKEGQYFSAYYSELDTLKGVFKNDEAYSGAFLLKKSHPEIRILQNGVVEKVLKYDHMIRLASEEYVDSGLIVFFKLSGDTLCTGKMKEGKPFTGVFWNYANRIARYENGFLNGLTEYFSGKGMITKKETYLNGKLDGEVTSFFNGKTYRSIYKNGTPFEGVVLDQLYKKHNYSDGVLIVKE